MSNWYIGTGQANKSVLKNYWKEAIEFHSASFKKTNTNINQIWFSRVDYFIVILYIIIFIFYL